jgi:hypothetical protein
VTARRPWRRDALGWALKYGGIATLIAFVMQQRGMDDPALTDWQIFWRDLGLSLGLGVFCGLAVLVWRWRGALVDLDELQAAGRGGLGLPKDGLRKRPRPRRELPEDDDPSAILMDYEAGMLPLQDAARRLAAFPEEEFRSDSLNYERGAPQEWVNRMVRLYEEVERLRGRR